MSIYKQQESLIKKKVDLKKMTLQEYSQNYFTLKKNDVLTLFMKCPFSFFFLLKTENGK